MRSATQPTDEAHQARLQLIGQRRMCAAAAAVHV